MRLRLLGFYFLLFHLIMIPIIKSEVPKLINYSGKLVDTDGNLLTDGDYTMEFSLWNDPNSTDLSKRIWFEKHEFTTAVRVTNGLFNVVLGNINPLPNFQEKLYIQCEFYIDATKETFPRQELVSVPYAMRAEYANHVNIPQVHSGIRDITDYSDANFYVLLTQTPKEITLSLHLEKFTEIPYRELAKHSHAGTGNTNQDNNTHTHTLRMVDVYGTGSPGWGLASNEQNSLFQSNWVGPNDSNHTHSFSLATNDSGGDLGISGIQNTYSPKQ